MRSPLALIVWLVFASACAPTTLSPSVIRTTAGDPSRIRSQLGLQTGPRLSSPYATLSGGFEGDRNSFALPQWSIAYDFDAEQAITRALSAHFGAQGEFYYPFPFPGYGVYGGMSYRFDDGPFAFAPAITVRGATDFGIGILGGPGTLVGTELTINFAYTTREGVMFGIVPFAGIHRVYAAGATEPSFYTGFVFALQLERDIETLQAVAGFGRVSTKGQDSWNSPILGFRVGR